MAKNTRIKAELLPDANKRQSPSRSQVLPHTTKPRFFITLPEVANPVEWITLSAADDPEKTRNIYCQYYARCLDWAVKERWDGFACIECELFTKGGKE